VTATITREDNSGTPPVSEAVLARARAAVREHYASCFWFWNPNAAIETEADVRQVIGYLRKNGGKAAWRLAQEIQKCL
jgi:hypothetical protein